MSALMKHRRGTSAEWNFVNPVLSEGELGVEEDTGIIKIGDGASTWAELQPAFSSHYLPRLGKAYDSDRLDGLDSAAFAKTEDVAGFATTTDLTNQRTALDKLILPAGADRKLVVHHGSVNEYPATANVKTGDRCYYTPLLSEMYWTGTVWRQAAIPSITVAQRKALFPQASPLYTAFQVHESDTGRRWLYDGGAWQYLDSGVAPRVRLIGANVTGLPQTDGPWNSWAAPEYDSDGFWDAANMQIKIPVGFGGTYDLAFFWNLGGTTATTSMFTLRAIRKARTAQTSPPTSAIFSASCPTSIGPLNASGPIRVADGDIVSLQYWTNQASLAGGGSQFGTPSSVTLTYTGRYS